jgi:hypothetical protein
MKFFGRTKKIDKDEYTPRNEAEAFVIEVAEAAEKANLGVWGAVAAIKSKDGSPDGYALAGFNAAEPLNPIVLLLDAIRGQTIIRIQKISCRKRQAVVFLMNTIEWRKS